MLPFELMKVFISAIIFPEFNCSSLISHLMSPFRAEMAIPNPEGIVALCGGRRLPSEFISSPWINKKRPYEANLEGTAPHSVAWIQRLYYSAKRPMLYFVCHGGQTWGDDWGWGGGNRSFCEHWKGAWAILLWGQGVKWNRLLVHCIFFVWIHNAGSE